MTPTQTIAALSTTTPLAVLTLAVHDASVIAQRVAPGLNVALEREGADRPTALLAVVVMLAGTIAIRDDAEEVTGEVCALLRACVRAVRAEMVGF